ncbi:hypothetical protein ACLOJK_025105 [Asimina triloba]
MNYLTSAETNSAGTKMAPGLCAANVTFHQPNGEVMTSIKLPIDYQQHLSCLLKDSHVLQKDINRYYAATTPLPLPTCVAKPPSDIYNGASMFCPSSYEHYPKNGNVSFLLDPKVTSYQIPTNQSSAHTLQPSQGGLSYQINRDNHLQDPIKMPSEFLGAITVDDFDCQTEENSFLPNTDQGEDWHVDCEELNLLIEDKGNPTVDASISTAHGQEWQVESTGLLIGKEGNPTLNEVYGAAQDLPTCPMKSQDCKAGEEYACPVKEPLDLNPSVSVADSGTKQRMRWTIEHHDRFVKAVDELGGPDSYMTYWQKFRLARYQPAAKEGESIELVTAGNHFIDNISVTAALMLRLLEARLPAKRYSDWIIEYSDKRSASSEGKKRISADLENGKSEIVNNILLAYSAFREHGSLRLRFELQKFLREQLEFQRTFQLQAKQSVDQLQMLLEEQKKVSQAFFQAHKPVSSVSSSSGKEASSDPPAADEVQILTDRYHAEDGCFKGDIECDRSSVELDAQLPASSHKRPRLEMEHPDASFLNMSQEPERV